MLTFGLKASADSLATYYSRYDASDVMKDEYVPW